MRLSTEQHDAIANASVVLLRLYYCEASSPVEKEFFSKLRYDMEIVKHMPYGEDK